jgi:hypothetical protein
MNGFLLVVVGIIYFIVAVNYLTTGNYGLFVTFLCYSVGNYGLYLAGKI